MISEALLLLAILWQEKPLRPLNDHVLSVVRGYPTDGTFGYWWPKGSSWEGTTQDLIYEGTKIASGDPKKRSYCCGLTFEVFFKAYERACAQRKMPFRIGALTPVDLQEMRLRWFGASDKTKDRRKLVQEAIVSMGLGVAVGRLEDARPGDFVQFWRTNGSGHSVIFLKWEVRDRKIAGLTYWSTQPSTKGIGTRTEWVREGGIARDEIHIARVMAGAP